MVASGGSSNSIDAANIALCGFGLAKQVVFRCFVPFAGLGGGCVVD